MLRDARTMTGPVPLLAPEHIREKWTRYGQELGFLRKGIRVRPAEIVETGLTIKAYVSEARWVTDCPLCHSGIATWPEMPDACCTECGCLYEIEFPDRVEIQQAELALAARPSDHERHWHPHKGETARDLRHDNIRYGYVPEGTPPDAPVVPALPDQLRSLVGDGPEAAKTIDLLRQHGVI